MQGEGAFTRAAVDVFRFTCKAVGEMHMLRISHNNIGHSPDWHLEKVFMAALRCFCVAKKLAARWTLIGGS